MLKYIFRFFFVLISILISYSNIQAQEERKLSLSVYGGAAFFPKGKTNQAALPTRIFGGFKPAPLIGFGVYYQLTKKLQLGENYSYLINATTGSRTFNNHAFRTTLKYYILKDRRINPYVLGSVNFNLMSLSRKENEYKFIPTAGNNTNIIGSGIYVDSIHYRENALKLSQMPTMGVSVGAGFEFKITKKIYFFAEYNINENLGKNNALIEKYYFYNKSNFVYHSVTAGINIKLFKPQKQLLATLDRDDWRNSRSIDVKGTIIYKNPAKPYKKTLPVEQTDTLETVLKNTPTDEHALVFFSKGIEPGEYQFMLPKKHRKIIRADLQILNYNKIEIADDELQLDMVEDEVSENILSRDANFAVLLREGFQHEIELTTTAENIMGTYIPADTNCKIRIVLRDQYDSVIAYIDTLGSNKFNFVDIAPGDYKVTFNRLNNECTQTRFNYSFTGAAPYIRKQSNRNEPEDTVISYSINGIVSTSDTKADAPKGTISKLIDPSGRVEIITTLAGTKNNFNYRNLNSPNYSAAYEDPTNKASMSYKVKDKKATIIREVNMSPVPKKAPNTGSILVKGKVTLPAENQAKTVTALLIDSTGKIKQKLPVNPDGSFSFDNLAKNKYKVAYESTDPLIKGKLEYKTIDKSVKINKIVLPVLSNSIEEFDTIHFYKTILVNKNTKDTIVQNNNSVTKDTIGQGKDKNVFAKDTITEVVNKNLTTPKQVKTKVVPVRYLYKDFKPGSTYNDLGFIVNPTGYGVQVSSFFINSNLEKFCQRLKAKGERNIFIQVVMKDKNNPNAGTIYRVILGADENKEKMVKKIPAYMDKGYDAVLRKHLL
jgi:hypothetical protein